MDEQLIQILGEHFSRWPQAVAEAVPEDEIARVEAQLGLRLPDDYRDFVQRYGSGIVRGATILGLRQCEFSTDDPPLFPDQTGLFRPQLPAEFSGMVVISVDLSGNPIGFLSGSPTVFVYDYNFGGRHDLAVSFSEFVQRKLAGEFP